VWKFSWCTAFRKAGTAAAAAGPIPLRALAAAWRRQSSGLASISMSCGVAFAAGPPILPSAIAAADATCGESLPNARINGSTTGWPNPPAASP
jgi:hypothetical protein